MSDQTSISVSRVIDAPASEIFDVLSNPARHKEFDGSGMIVNGERNNRISGTGEVFTMEMHAERMGGDYQTENHVVGFDENALLAWRTAPAGTEPKGWEWVYRLTPQGPDQTEVTLTYDWSDVTDKALLERVKFPAIPESALEDSLARLAEVVSS